MGHRGGRKFRRGGRETQTGDQGLPVISCSKYIDKLDGQTGHGRGRLRRGEAHEGR